MKRGWRYYSAFFVLLVLLDRITKMLIMSSGYQTWHLSSWLTLTRSLNRGISFSLLSFNSDYYYLVVSLMVAFLCLALFQYTYRRWKEGYTVGYETAVLAGACSNFLDRIWYGGVVDFIEVSYATWIWPAFNVADMLIVCGLLIMCIKGFNED